MAEDPGTNAQVRLAFQIGYIGASFSGSQIQPDKRTVEGEIEAACLRAGLITSRKDSRLALSGRTDGGVHARCQILAFSTMKPDLSIRALNGQLPPDIWVYSWSHVPDEFHPRFDICNRTYRFYFSKVPPDFQAMKDAASLFLGTHDFTCFARIEPGKNPIRTIEKLEVNTDGIWYWLEITANSFLWHMVRSIATALFYISDSSMTILDLSRFLEGTCKNKIKPAAPDGLILWDVKTDLTWKNMTLPKIKSLILQEKSEYQRLKGRVYTLLTS